MNPDDFKSILDTGKEVEEGFEADLIMPTVLVIHPSGYTEFLSEDLSSMSLSEIGALIDGEDLEAVHFSENLNRITRECGLENSLVMFFARKSMNEDAEENYVGKMLHQKGFNVRGAIIVALEDNEHNTSSFENDEDIENVFEAIDDMTGILRRETDDYGQYDAWS